MEVLGVRWYGCDAGRSPLLLLVQEFGLLGVVPSAGAVVRWWKVRGRPLLAPSAAGSGAASAEAVVRSSTQIPAHVVGWLLLLRRGGAPSLRFDGCLFSSPSVCWRCSFSGEGVCAGVLSPAVCVRACMCWCSCLLRLMNICRFITNPAFMNLEGSFIVRPHRLDDAVNRLLLSYHRAFHRPRGKDIALASLQARRIT